MDKTDEMFDIGRDDIEWIMNYMPAERQTVFSATIPDEIVKLQKYQINSKIIK